jgi:hypothetical protein
MPGTPTGTRPVGGSSAPPSQESSPSEVRAQWLAPSVNVARPDAARMYDSPVEVCWTMSPLAGSRWAHSTGLPILSPSAPWRPASGAANVGASLVWQNGAS